MTHQIPTASQIARKRKWEHDIRGVAVKLAPKENSSRYAQAPYYFIEGDWAGKIVYCEPRKFVAVERRDGQWVEA